MARINRRAFLAAGGSTALGSQIFLPNEATARELGAGRSGYSDRSKYETSERYFNPGSTPGTGSGRTPLQDLHGIITPSSLHFERHHSGIPDIDPAHHELVLH